MAPALQWAPVSNPCGSWQLLDPRSPGSPWLLFPVPSQVYSSSEFLAVQTASNLAERSFSEDREEGWERAGDGDGSGRLGADTR